jgi:hypothetical protein
MIVPFALTNITGHIDVGEEVHLDFDHSPTLTLLTPAPFDIEAKATFIKPT